MTLYSCVFSIHKSGNTYIHASGCKISKWAVTIDEKKLSEEKSTAEPRTVAA